MGSLNPPNDLYGHACSTGAGIRRHLGERCRLAIRFAISKGIQN
jgi:hypothetical protein